MELRPWDKLQELLPPLASYEFEALKASIAKHGLLQRILVLPDGRIIDGYHRWEIVGNKLPKDILNLDEQTAFLLGLAMNTARRQMSLDQIKELRKKHKKIALELRKTQMSQEKVAGILGVARQTINLWEGTSIASDSNACNPPDLRFKIPKKEQKRIKERVAAGESQRQVAADFKITQQRVSQIVKNKNMKDETIAIEEYSKGNEIYTGDYSLLDELLSDNSVDLFFTDPPYDEKSIELFEGLAKLAQAKLKLGGLCLTYSGQSHLDEIFAAMSKHLDYWWAFAIFITGNELRIWSKSLWVRWKPVLVFTKRPANGRLTDTWCCDCIQGGGRDKRFHKWGQNVQEAAYWIEALAPENGLVVDPFCGGGTIPLACKLANRRWLATEKDEATAAIARKRLQSDKKCSGI